MKKSVNLTTGGLGTVVQDALREDYNLVARPRLTVDWNLNRFAIPTAENDFWPDSIYGIDIENFPNESIYEVLRPTKGVTKARVNAAIVSPGYTAANDPKFYMGSPDDLYKYWTSPSATYINGYFPADGNGPTCQPFVKYDRILKSNKIVIKTENTWATMDIYQVYVQTTVNGAWNAIAGVSPTMDLKTGQLTLYYNGTAWVTTKPATLVTTNVAGIKLVVTKMKGGYRKDGTPTTYNYTVPKTGTVSTGWSRTGTPTTGVNAFFDLIAIEPHREEDFSSRLITVNDEFDMSETSQIYPVGTITSNQATVTLDNTDGVFNYENTVGPYYGLLEPNAEFNLEYIYTVHGVDYSVQQFKMYSETWAVSDDNMVVELQDYSKYLKEIKPIRTMFEGQTATQLIWRVCDQSGFTNYEIQTEDVTTDHIIPVFWLNGEQTLWEVLDSLAQASQTAIYFDGRGVLQVRVREASFNPNRATDWTLLGQMDDDDLPDIMSLEQTQEFEANSVDVIYKTTKWKIDAYGNPAMSNVWEPDEDVLVVRSSPLAATLSSTGNTMILPQNQVIYWPYESLVQVDGELIRYRGKFYVYFTGDFGQIQNVAWVNNQEEYLACFNNSSPDYRYKNYFTGHVLITERGVWNTSPVDHPVDINGWSTHKEIQHGSTSWWNNARGLTHDPGNSLVHINTPQDVSTGNDIFWATRGTDGPGFKDYGTRLRFNSGGTVQRAGIQVFHGGPDDGYLIELRPTNQIGNRATHNELMLYRRKDRNYQVLHKGVAIGVAENIWYDLDVSVEKSGGTHTILVWFNGMLMFKYVADTGFKVDPSNRLSMYARGNTSVSFEYVYGVDRTAGGVADNYSFYDLKYGAVRGGGWDFEQVWQLSIRYKRIFKKAHIKDPYMRLAYLFDEFGPYVHEVREFDVEFDPAPVQYSTLYSTNSWFAAVVEYVSTPFGAKFIIANAARTHAILHGEDNLTYAGAGATVNQACVVLGRDLEVSDAEKVNKRNEIAIRSRGLIETEMDNEWIQSKDMADAIATWIVNHWGTGVDELRVEIFGNPLIEVGDIVAINYVEKSMTPTTHRYFVTGVTNEFDGGVGTTLTLRRALMPVVSEGHP